jgi:hypothetical protein
MDSGWVLDDIRWKSLGGWKACQGGRHAAAMRLFQSCSEMYLAENACQRRAHRSHMYRKRLRVI